MKEEIVLFYLFEEETSGTFPNSYCSTLNIKMSVLSLSQCFCFYTPVSRHNRLIAKKCLFFPLIFIPSVHTGLNYLPFYCPALLRHLKCQLHCEDSHSLVYMSWKIFRACFHYSFVSFLFQHDFFVFVFLSFKILQTLKS